MPENEETTTEEATTEQEETPKGGTETDPSDEVAKWKALARKNEEQAKKNADAAKKLQELEDAQKTDQQKQAERLAELETTAKSSSLEAARLRVALRKGLTETQAKRLVGDSEEELEQDADDLLATFAPSGDDDGSTLSRRPQERLRPGATPSAEPEKSPDELVDAVIKRRGF